MKYKFLDILVCPYCKDHLELRVFEEKAAEAKPAAGMLACRSYCSGMGVSWGGGHIIDGQTPCEKCSGYEIEEGLLVCKCEAFFPIVRGIPRMLPSVAQDYPEFFEKHKDKIEPLAQSLTPYRGRGSFQKLHGRTKEAFSYEWMELYDLEIDAKRNNEAVFRAQTGFGPEAFAGKLVMDAGCGMGRNMRFAADWAGEIVGMDLGEGIEQAARIMSGRRNVHFVQGNIMQPPFRAKTIDAIYSLGVLHHTPDARKSYLTLASLLKPGGAIAVWLYARSVPLKDALNDALRKVTSKMPMGALGVLCAILAIKGTIERALRMNPITLPLAKIVGFFPIAPFTGSSPKIRYHETFDWYAPPYQSKHTNDEAVEWAKKAGFEKIRIMGYPVSVVGVGKLEEGEKREPEIERAEQLRGIDYLLLEEKRPRGAAGEAVAETA